MKKIRIKSDRSYEVLIGASWQDEFSRLRREHQRVLLIVPSKLRSFVKDLKGVDVLLVPDAELQKDAKVLSKIWDKCAEIGLKRDDAIVAIGGGATTDLAGFAAATWLRGIAWYAFPTSLAGAVDAAIGGKTGINSRHGKNLIGSFYSPSKVVIDLKIGRAHV